MIRKVDSGFLSRQKRSICAEIMLEQKRSMNFRGALQRLFESFERKILGALRSPDRRLATGAEFAGLGNFCGDIDRDHDRAVLIGVDQVVGAHGHAGRRALRRKVFGMHPGMRRADRAGQRLKSPAPIAECREIEPSVMTPRQPSALCTLLCHFAPEGAVADVGAVDVLETVMRGPKPVPTYS